jgi:hypothetical protein
MVLNKLIKEYKEMCLEYVPVEEVLEDLQKLEDIYKPKDVPQFVVDWYEKYKGNLEYNIWAWMRCLERGEGVNKQFHLWLNNCNNKPVETLVKMKLYGYKVKEEIKYNVKVVETKQILYKSDEGAKFVDIYNTTQHKKYEFTKEELTRYGMAYVFNNKGFKVEKVEE